MRSIFYACILACLSCTIKELPAAIYEITHFEQILPYLEEKPLLILDIDNTLIEPNQTLGSDQWFYHRLDYYQLEFGLNCHSEISPMNQSENDLIRHLLLIGIYSGV